MTTIGFIGPGVMGAPMATNLVRGGHDVKVFGRSSASRKRAEETGGTVASTIEEACADAEIVMTMLPDGPAVDEAVNGDRGVLAALSRNAVLIDHSTISPGESSALHSAAATRGVRCLDAPVSGGEAGAIEGTLSIMVGGDPTTFEEVKPLLDLEGKTVVRVGSAGAGQVVKAANQLMVAGHIQMLAEAVLFLRAHDADLASALDVIGGGLAGSTVLDRKRHAILSGDFSPGFRITLHDKDLGIVADAARRNGLSMPATSLVSALVASVKARGDGELDHSSLYGLLIELNGMSVTTTNAKS